MCIMCVKWSNLSENAKKMSSLIYQPTLRGQYPKLYDPDLLSIFQVIPKSWWPLQSTVLRGTGGGDCPTVSLTGRGRRSLESAGDLCPAPRTTGPKRHQSNYTQTCPTGSGVVRLKRSKGPTFQRLSLNWPAVRARIPLWWRSPYRMHPR